jgi:hypothetical protein
MGNEPKQMQGLGMIGVRLENALARRRTVGQAAGREVLLGNNLDRIARSQFGPGLPCRWRACNSMSRRRRSSPRNGTASTPRRRRPQPPKPRRQRGQSLRAMSARVGGSGAWSVPGQSLQQPAPMETHGMSTHVGCRRRPGER